ncbi:hypothetical protein ACFQY4_30590 [Catellatospora bangladeshensis]
MLAPANACTSIPHPNLWAWQSLRAELGEDEHAIAVFADDLTQSGGDPHVAAMLAEVAAR